MNIPVPRIIVNESTRNTRPEFFSDSERELFEKTPKRELFKMLRDCAVQLASFEFDGYADHWVDDPEKWINEALRRKENAV